MRKLTIPGTTLEKEVGEGFNRAALAFGAFWYFYKGMWLRGLLYTIVALIAPGISWIFVWVYAGFRANQEYYEHLVKKGYRDSTDSTVAASTAVTKQTDSPSIQNTAPIKSSGLADKVKMVGIAIVVVFLILTGIALFAPSDSSKSPNQTNKDSNTKQASVKSEADNKEEIAKQEAENKWLESVATTYCNAHKKTDFSKGYIKFTGVTKENGGEFTLDDCKKIITYFKENSPNIRKAIGEPSDEESVKQVIGNIADRKIQMGMHIYELAASWGTPDDINTTKTQFGENQQWVYGNVLTRSQYVYLDGEETAKLKVTSWQDF